MAGCPKYVCSKCGKPRKRIIDTSERINTRPGKNVGTAKSGKDIDPNKELHISDLSKFRQKIIYKENGYTDCNCGNIGALMGVELGANKIPAKWKIPLQDTFSTFVKGHEKWKISELAQRIANIGEKVMKEKAQNLVRITR